MNVIKKTSDIRLRTIAECGLILLIACMFAVTFNQLRPQGLRLVGDWSPEARLTLESGETIAIPLQEAEAFYHAGAAVFLDARDPEFYALGHIEGARNLPWEEFDQYFDPVMAGIPSGMTIITYCDGEECNLSKDVALVLMEKGYTNVKVLVNGWTLWQDHQLPVSTSLEGASLR